PLSNQSAQARAKYYGANGAPTIYLDGERNKPGEGLKTEAESVFRNLDASIGTRLEAPARARIKIDATLEGKSLKVIATVDGIQAPPSDLKVQLALVEEQVSYSGENGLRFHPMVVRNMGGPTADAYGFPIAGTQTEKVEHVFDLEQITAANLKYYDDYIAEMTKRLGGRAEISFKEKRYLIDRDKLAVVAFVQDEKTKEVLQATYVKVAPAVSQSGR
ncbi:MAG: Omp28-related outer membrane protein, partial [Acidobacteriota bacterium]